MATVTLRDLYAAELHDLMNAEPQILQELPTMAARATSQRLRRAFEDHLAETKVHIDRLRLLIEQLNEPVHGVPGGAVAALIEDNRRRSGNAERGEILDAALIAAAQRIEHFEMASYGCARSYAEALGDYDAARILQQTLDEEGHMDHELTRIAERGVNAGASEGLVEDSTRYRSRLRYVAAHELPDASGRDLHLHSRDEEHLGTLDGFIVESQGGRPLYFVIDSRGWFAGRRYVVPVGQIDVNQAGDTLFTDLTRHTLSRYPEFSPGAFAAMDDDDALRYERSLHRAFVPDDASPYDGRPVYENLPVYKTPPGLMTGVWMTDASGFAVTPPHADSDLASIRPVPPPAPETGAYERTASGGRDSGSGIRTPNQESQVPNPESRIPTHEGELVTARAEDERQPSPPEPRIERYKER
jgi:ferritin-like metal-binding protein YciE